MIFSQTKFIFSFDFHFFSLLDDGKSFLVEKKNIENHKASPFLSQWEATKLSSNPPCSIFRFSAPEKIDNRKKFFVRGFSACVV